MGWLGALFNSGKTISDPIDAVGNALDKLFTSDEERAKAQFVLEKLRQQPQILQAEIIKMEVQHKSRFVAGAHASVVWVCSTALAFGWIINPCIQWITGLSGPRLPLDDIGNLIVAILGLGAYHTYEKVKGVAK